MALSPSARWFPPSFLLSLGGRRVPVAATAATAATHSAFAFTSSPGLLFFFCPPHLFSSLSASCVCILPREPRTTIFSPSLFLFFHSATLFFSCRNNTTYPIPPYLSPNLSATRQTHIDEPSSHPIHIHIHIHTHPPPPPISSPSLLLTLSTHACDHLLSRLRHGHEEHRVP